MKFVLTIHVNPDKQPELYAFLKGRTKYDKQIRRALDEYVKGRGAQTEQPVKATKRTKADFKHLGF